MVLYSRMACVPKSRPLVNHFFGFVLMWRGKERTIMESFEGSHSLWRDVVRCVSSSNLSDSIIVSPSPVAGRDGEEMLVIAFRKILQKFWLA